MQTQAIDNKNRLILGLGQTGLSVARYLSAQNQPFKVMDTRTHPPGADELAKIDKDALVDWNGQKMLGYDQLVVSPGIAVTNPDIARAKDFGVEIVGDIELFAQANTTPVIAITGSNGKSTVTELVGLLLEASGNKALVGGNIGMPALELLQHSEKDAVSVLELSSFQLETTYTLQPAVATILNVSEDHLDRYADYKEYVEAKQRIFNHAKKIVVNAEDEVTQPGRTGADVTSFGFGSKSDWQVDLKNGALVGHHKKLMSLNELTLQGAHNALNVAAAFALLDAVGIPIDEAVIQSAKHYAGMPHRSQLVAVKNGVTFINDSKATNVGATVAAINSFAPKFNHKIVLIAGGDAKGSDLSSLADSINKHAKTLICFGKDGVEIASLAQDRSVIVENLSQAVEQAVASSKPGDCVLLSPACASWDMFKNYIERGEQFEQLVEAL
ncbi:UDP-N-acetylmuramoyl-L-alanine--D-glutamate ligase [Kangiella sediminilitoris]|uniref:UDP-N-acetylmuramoylalanine--D-glutamate ligase n=1 Tax=Kangiella sediminilitoris TaxID=1144748 RepID=A0A1B3BCJ4_9GAMM|nr:UDP-N-acetylmuramoyl-L-alanine--D-glutamate ligase [Kangiella sediminilitoris]AOE50467.1 UDP-N-acetylmuramoylalanine--D-glutamate ligase [Kangiella sediminilitoris]